MTEGKRRRLAWSLSLLLAGAGAGMPAEAMADDAEMRSRGLFAQGEALANNGHWGEACPLFQAAHDLHGTGGTALRAADCYEKVGKYERALEMYQFIVDHRDTDKEPERLTVAEGRVGALKKQLGLDRPVVPVPPPVATQAPPPPAPPPPSKVPAYAAFGAGGVGLVVGAVFGGLALDQAKQVKAICIPNMPCPQERPEISAAETKAWVSNIGFAVAVAGAVVGVVYLMTASAPKAQAAVRHVLGPGGVILHF